jgi:phenylpropionate dioxygenase-like ring-hydroxylating dioxygenase large terminal subunit
MAVYNLCIVLLLLLVKSNKAFTSVSLKKAGLQRSRPFPLPVTTSPSDVQDTTDVNASSKGKPDAVDNLRPFHQNWWPVSALNALDISKPNGFLVLGKHLVAVWNQADAAWTVLDDKCSHRFAPLSEGRVLHPEAGSKAASCVQCAYHGWQFESTTGECTTVPQQPDKVSKARPVASYPTRERAGLLWVWTDPTTAATLSTTVPLPVDPLLDRFIDHFGNDAAYMRDLPYGMELLGENLVDLSHLPFAHHSVGGLRRDLGGELPTKMLSQSAKVEKAAWEKEYISEDQIVLPTFQVEIQDAAKHDPILKSFMARMKDPVGADKWTCTVAYFNPGHVRYRRSQGPGKGSHVELFMCPTTQGRSRVFLYNIFEAFIPSKDAEKKPEPTRQQRMMAIAAKPSTWVPSMKMVLLKKLFPPSRAAGHMIGHKIFDGDGIFLNKQGNRMKESSLSFRDYSTPSSADALLNAYRRYLDSVATKTREAGLDEMADAVVGSSEYGDDAPRSVMLDRYNTHTVNCPSCSSALKETQAKKRRNKVIQTSLQGATGASLTGLATLVAITRVATVSLAPRLIGIVTGLATATCLGAIAASRSETKLDKEINQFLFEDYVHADKN